MADCTDGRYKIGRCSGLSALLPLACVLLFAFVVTSCSAQKSDEQSAGPEKKEVAWVTSRNVAFKKAVDDDKLVMIDFYAVWCGWCKKLDKDTYTDAGVVELSEKFVGLKVDAEKERKCAAKYKIEGFPTIVFTDPKENEIYRIGGYMPPGHFAEEMKKALEKHKKKD